MWKQEGDKMKFKIGDTIILQDAQAHVGESGVVTTIEGNTATLQFKNGFVKLTISSNKKCSKCGRTL